jgi:hypothetical protein
MKKNRESQTCNWYELIFNNFGSTEYLEEMHGKKSGQFIPSVSG